MKLTETISDMTNDRELLSSVGNNFVDVPITVEDDTIESITYTLITDSYGHQKQNMVIRALVKIRFKSLPLKFLTTILFGKISHQILLDLSSHGDFTQSDIEFYIRDIDFVNTDGKPYNITSLTKNPLHRKTLWNLFGKLSNHITPNGITPPEIISNYEGLQDVVDVLPTLTDEDIVSVEKFNRRLEVLKKVFTKFTIDNTQYNIVDITSVNTIHHSDDFRRGGGKFHTVVTITTDTYVLLEHVEPLRERVNTIMSPSLYGKMSMDIQFTHTR